MSHQEVRPSCCKPLLHCCDPSTARSCFEVHVEGLCVRMQCLDGGSRAPPQELWPGSAVLHIDTGHKSWLRGGGFLRPDARGLHPRGNPVPGNPLLAHLLDLKMLDQTMLGALLTKHVIICRKQQRWESTCSSGQFPTGSSRRVWWVVSIWP